MQKIPSTMRAVTITAAGPPEVLQPAAVTVPAPREREVLIRVQAAGVNRPDVLQRLGLYPVPPDASPLPGLEVAGEVVAIGPGASRWSVGDAVMALTHGGGYAEYCRVDERHCLPRPAALSPVEAAAVPETFFTVWYNVFMRCALAAGETLLVHGGSSGIGTTAIQLAKAADCTSSVSQVASAQRMKTLYQTVKKVSGTAAASTGLSAAGRGRQCRSSTRQYSA